MYLLFAYSIENVSELCKQQPQQQQQHLPHPFHLTLSIPALSSSLAFPEDDTSTLTVPFLSLSVAADSGVSSVLQADDLIGQQNGNYQSLPEPISSGQMISSPPALVDRQTPASDESFLQAANQGPEAAYQHPGAYQPSTAHLRQGPYQSQTVSPPDRSFFSSSYKISTIICPLFFILFCFLTQTRVMLQLSSILGTDYSVEYFSNSSAYWIRHTLADSTTLACATSLLAH